LGGRNRLWEDGLRVEGNGSRRSDSRRKKLTLGGMHTLGRMSYPGIMHCSGGMNNPERMN